MTIVSVPGARESRYGLVVDTAFAELKERVSEIEDLERTSSLLGWDQQVKMPPGGAGVRAEQLATLNRISHEALTSDEIGTAARQAVGLRRVAAVRLVRGEPDPARPSRLGEGTARAGRAAR